MIPDLQLVYFELVYLESLGFCGFRVRGDHIVRFRSRDLTPGDIRSVAGGARQRHLHSQIKGNLLASNRDDQLEKKKKKKKSEKEKMLVLACDWPYRRGTFRCASCPFPPQTPQWQKDPKKRLHFPQKRHASEAPTTEGKKKKPKKKLFIFSH